ncbi:hypothetical protein F3J23_04400 [Chryseobacterium sp. Tr-659]|uniref:hypothetical protein n=1 Tax=Chryseobacterium sp. Tr-659 TaxID=2608340 RepID=UPI0014235D87|nr:hypothetical protein [Chryseobacterium sp. Tr-659]NIF04675.1 hypothetical protein [Chryseobacterium sp. Tr-659]
MKKIIITAALFSFAFFYSQKNQNYLEVGYASICCGPPSEKPVVSYLKEFKRKNRVKSLEILMQSRLGREGEYKLYIGTDFLSKNQKSRLIRGLMATVSNQNNNKQQPNKGNVNFDPEIIVSQSDLTDAKNLTIYKK